LDGSRCVKKEKMEFISIYGCTRGFVEFVQDIKNMMGLSDNGDTPHHSIVKKLAVQDGRLEIV